MKHLITITLAALMGLLSGCFSTRPDVEQPNPFAGMSPDQIEQIMQTARADSSVGETTIENSPEDGRRMTFRIQNTFREDLPLNLRGQTMEFTGASMSDFQNAQGSLDFSIGAIAENATDMTPIAHGFRFRFEGNEFGSRTTESLAASFDGQADLAAARGGAAAEVVRTSYEGLALVINAQGVREVAVIEARVGGIATILDAAGNATTGIIRELSPINLGIERGGELLQSVLIETPEGSLKRGTIVQPASTETFPATDNPSTAPTE